RQLVNVLDHFAARHPVAGVDNAELADAFEVVGRPVDVPDDLAGPTRSQNGLDRVLRELAEELQRVTVLAEPIEEESDVMNGHSEDLLLAGGGTSAHHDLLARGGYRDREA